MLWTWGNLGNSNFQEASDDFLWQQEPSDVDKENIGCVYVAADGGFLGIKCLLWFASFFQNKSVSYFPI